MRPADLAHLDHLLALAGDGRLTRSDAIALLILAREQVPAGSVVRELGDCIAHRERDRGAAKRYLNEWAESTIAALTRGGAIETNVLYPVETVVDELVDLAVRMKLPSDLDAIRQQSEPLAMVVAEALDGTTVAMKDPALTATFNAGAQPTFNIRSTGRVAWFAPGVGIAGPLLIDAMGRIA